MNHESVSRNEYDELETQIVQTAVDVIESNLHGERILKMRELMVLIDECSPMQWERIMRPPEGIKTPVVCFRRNADRFN